MMSGVEVARAVSMALLVALAGCAAHASEAAFAPPPTSTGADAATRSSTVTVSPPAGPSPSTSPPISPHAPATAPPAPATASSRPGPAPTELYWGVGSQVVDIELPVRGEPALISITHASTDEWRPFSLWAFDDDLAQLGLLTHQLGSFAGTVPIDLDPGERATSYLGVDARGAWSLRIESLSALRRVDGPVDGEGPATFFHAGATTPVRVRSDDEWRFSVHSGGEALIDSIGVYGGDVVLPGEQLVVVQAGGYWSITPASD